MMGAHYHDTGHAGIEPVGDALLLKRVIADEVEALHLAHILRLEGPGPLASKERTLLN